MLTLSRKAPLTCVLHLHLRGVLNVMDVLLVTGCEAVSPPHFVSRRTSNTGFHTVEVKLHAGQLCDQHKWGKLHVLRTCMACSQRESKGARAHSCEVL